MLMPLLLVGLWDRFLVAPSTGRGGTDEMMRTYAAAEPDIVILGNSVTRTAFDEQALQADLERAGIHQRVFKYHLSATGPAIWYLVLKNVIIPSEHRPSVLLLAARDHMLANTTYGVDAVHMKQYLPLYAGKYEPVLEQKVFVAPRQRRSLDRLLYENSSIYYNRDDYQRAARRLFFSVSADLSEFAASITGATGALQRISSLRAAFGEGEGLAGALRRAYDDPSSEVAYGDAPEDEFDASGLRSEAGLSREELVRGSFLPDMLALCREHGIRLIVVRHHSSPLLDEGLRENGQAELEAVRDYLAQEAPEVDLIDMQSCPGIGPEHFYAGQHYTQGGQAILTEYLAQQLIPLLR
jgi:hypothetical protein